MQNEGEFSIEEQEQITAIINKILEHIEAIIKKFDEIFVQLDLIYLKIGMFELVHNKQLLESVTLLKETLRLQVKDTQISKETIGKNLTKQVSKIKQEGRLPLIHPEIVKRNYREFMEDREKQILRHVATQIYLALQLYELKDLVEVQIMHLSFNGRHNLFVVANKPRVTESFTKIIKKDNFKELYQSQKI